MKLKSYADMNCSLAQSLEVIGERLVFVDRVSGEPIQRMQVRGATGEVLSPRDVMAEAGPAPGGDGAPGLLT